MASEKQHKLTLYMVQSALKAEVRPPEEHRRALRQEQERFQLERPERPGLPQDHRNALEEIRRQLAEERAYARRVYERNRWWIELLLKWWESHRAA